MPRTFPPGRTPHVILLRGTLTPCGTMRAMFCQGPILVEKGGEHPLFKSRQDAHYCIKRTKKVHARLSRAMLDTSYWPKGLPEFQIMAETKWKKLRETPKK